MGYDVMRYACDSGPERRKTELKQTIHLVRVDEE